ncbi:MAG: glycosyltransferase [Clostridia bacterium]|nr:glycosyltransferase [Clostridia bacterium]
MISVIISAFKGEMYIEEAIRSILSQLPSDGEIIVCDGLPGGATGRVVSRLAAEDSRVILIDGKSAGATENTVHALRHCKGDRIFICSQKDVWLPDKIKRVNEAFASGADMVVHNAYITDEALNITEYSLFEVLSFRKGVISNILSNRFVGSCLAFDRKMLKFIMPIPKHVADSDQWIGIICSIFGTVKLLDLPLCYHRQLYGETAVQGSKEISRNRRYLISKLYKRVFIRR